MSAANAKNVRSQRPTRVLMLLENAAYSEDGRVRRLPESEPQS